MLLHVLCLSSFELQLLKVSLVRAPHYGERQHHPLGGQVGRCNRELASQEEVIWAEGTTRV